MADIYAALTTAGKALIAKINQGNGDIPLNIIRIVSSDGTSGDPLELTVPDVEIRQTFTVTDSSTEENRTIINAFITNIGNTNATPPVPPLAAGYLLSRILFFADDPDDGEIVFRVTQLENPIPVPSAGERPHTFKTTFNISAGNASEVIVQVDPSGLATIQYVDERIAALSFGVEVSANQIPQPGVKTHYFITSPAPYFRPDIPVPPPVISTANGFILDGGVVHPGQIQALVIQQIGS
jgi:hypothetical protein